MKKKRDLPPCLQFANTALKGSSTLVVLAIYCKISLCTIRRDDSTRIFLQEARKKNKDLFTDWRDDNTKIFLQETRKKNKDVFSSEHIRNFAKNIKLF